MKKTRFNSLYFTKAMELEGSLSKQNLKYADGIRYIFHFLTIGRIFQHGNEDYDGWISIYSQHLRLVIGDDYRKCVEIMRELDLIEIDEAYQNPKTATKIICGHCKRYRLTDWAINSKYERQIVGGRIAKYLSCKNRANSKYPLDKIDYHLKKFLKKITIRPIPSDVLQSVEQCQQLNLELIRLQDIRYVKDKNGRRHSNLTNMDSKLRPYVEYQGMPLIGIDIRNSQPLFLGWMLANIFENVDNQRKFLYLQGQTKEAIPYVSGSDILFSLKPLILRHETKVDGLFWLKTTENGTFYEKIQENSPHLSRQQIKKQTLTALYDNWENGRYTHKLVTALYGLFPDSMTLLRELKKNDYKILANAMQRRESSFIIDEVCTDLMVNHPAMPIITIHDSVLTTEPYLEILLKIVKDHFAKYNIYPTINLQKWTDKYEEKQIQL